MVPFLKWAGGKRWLVESEIDMFPKRGEYIRYLEPFLGGGAVFFHLEPQKGILSDLNSDLIACYKTIGSDWQAVYDELKQYDRKHSTEFYYRTRASKPKKDIKRAARFIYLNRTCWNGLYRVNRQGRFNVPIGTKTNVLLEEDNFEHLSKILNQMKFYHCDFEVTIDKSKKGDFIFIDPPYTVKHNLNGFIKYNEKIFSWDDQERLKLAIQRAITRGVKVLLLNAHHQSIIDLYKEIGQPIILKRASVIAANANARGFFTEIAIKCW